MQVLYEWKRINLAILLACAPLTVSNFDVRMRKSLKGDWSFAFPKQNEAQDAEKENMNYINGVWGSSGAR